MIARQQLGERHENFRSHGRVIGVGYDPDYHHTAMAIVFQETRVAQPRLIYLETMNVPSKLSGWEAIRESCRTAQWLVNHKQLATPQSFLGATSIAVESQEVYGRDSKVNPSQLVGLAQIAGAILGQLHYGPGVVVLRPPARDWKGDVPKETTQARVFRDLGIPCTLYKTKRERWCIPTGKVPGIREEFSATQWKHLVDAIGLAIWAARTTWPIS